MASAEVFDIEIPDGGTVHGQDRQSDDDSIEIDDVSVSAALEFLLLICSTAGC